MKIQTYLPKSKTAIPMALTFLAVLVGFQMVVSPAIERQQQRRLGGSA